MVSEFELQVINYISLTAIAIWYKLGGHPEGTYRILRIAYFVQFLFLEDGTIKRHVFKWDRIITASPPHFITKNGTFYIDRENSARSRGRPAWYYHIGKALPVPINTGQFQTPGYNLDPLTIKRAYRTDIARRLRSISEPKLKLRWLLWVLAGLVVLGIIYYLVL